MKQRRRFGIIFGGLSIVVLVVGWFTLRSLSFSGDECRVAAFRAFQPTGRVLKAVGLSSDQRIEITRIRIGDRQDNACTFIITGGESRRLVAIQRSVAYQNDWGAIAGDFVGSALRKITVDQQRDIDGLLRFLRKKTEPFSRGYDTYEVDYFSGDKKIGGEKAVDYLRLYSYYEDRSYDELPIGMRADVAIDDWKALQSASALLNDVEVQAASNFKSKQATSPR